MDGLAVRAAAWLDFWHRGKRITGRGRGVLDDLFS